MEVVYRRALTGQNRQGVCQKLSAARLYQSALLACETRLEVPGVAKGMYCSTYLRADRYEVFGKGGGNFLPSNIRPRALGALGLYPLFAEDAARNIFFAMHYDAPLGAALGQLASQLDFPKAANQKLIQRCTARSFSALQATFGSL